VMLRSSGSRVAFFKSYGPRTMAGTTSIHPFSPRKRHSPCQARNFAASSSDLTFPADLCAADSSPLGTPSKPRTLVQLPRPNFVVENSVLKVSSFTPATSGVEISDLSVGGTQ
jgi:hypothetical protein